MASARGYHSTYYSAGAESSRSSSSGGGGCTGAFGRHTMGWINCARVGTGTASLVLLVVGLGLLAAAIISPSWLFLDVDDTQRVGQGRKEGLWTGCFMNVPQSEQEEQSWDPHDQGWVCGIVDTMDFDMKDWEMGVRHTVLGLLCASFVLGFVTALVSYCGFCRKWLTVPWAVGSLLAVILAIVGTFMFYINYQALDARRVLYQHHMLERYKHFSWGLYVSFAACLLLLVNFVLTVPVAVLSFYYDEQKRRRGYNSAAPVVSTTSSSRARYKAGGRDGEPLYKYEDHTAAHTTVV